MFNIAPARRRVLRYGIQLTSRTIPGVALSTQLLSNPIASPDFFANHLPRYFFYLLLSFWIHVLFTCTVLSYGFSLKYSNTKGNYSRFLGFSPEDRSSPCPLFATWIFLCFFNLRLSWERTFRTHLKHLLIISATD